MTMWLEIKRCAHRSRRYGKTRCLRCRRVTNVVDLVEPASSPESSVRPGLRVRTMPRAAAAQGVLRAAILALGLAAASGCSGSGRLVPVAAGPCTLELVARDPEAGAVPLRPPYVVGMTARTPSGARSARVDYVASGWQDARITVTSPDGVTFPAAIRWFDRSSWGQGFDQPGIWTIRWLDEAAGCERELSILVVA